MENARNMNGLLQDAFKLAYQVFDGLSPNDKYVIINIGKTSNPTFTYTARPEIPTSYGYLYDKTPQFLTEEKVIIAKEPNRWWIGNGKSNDSALNIITAFARSKGLLKKDEWAKYLREWIYDHYNYGPNCPGQFAILIDVVRLKEFINKYSGQKPIFNDGIKSLEFLGQVVPFSGELTIKSVKLLVSNINALVTKEEFYEVGEHGNYQNYAKQKKLTKIDDALNKRFQVIKVKIENNPTLKKSLVLVNRGGYGMFVNQRIFTPQTPQATDSNS